MLTTNSLADNEPQISDTFENKNISEDSPTPQMALMHFFRLQSDRVALYHQLEK